MADPESSLATSAAVVFVGATVLIAAGANAGSRYELLIIPGFLIGVFALGAWYRAFREAGQDVESPRSAEALRRAIAEYHREQGSDSK